MLQCGPGVLSSKPLATAIGPPPRSRMERMPLAGVLLLLGAGGGLRAVFAGSSVTVPAGNRAPYDGDPAADPLLGWTGPAGTSRFGVDYPIYPIDRNCINPFPSYIPKIPILSLNIPPHTLRVFCTMAGC